MDRPVQQRPVHRRLQGVREAIGVAARELARAHGVFDQRADAGVHRGRTAQREPMEFRIGQVDLQKRQRVRDFLRRGAHERHAVGHRQERLQVRGIGLAQASKQRVVTLRRLPGERQQQLPLRPEPLDERRRGEADLAGDVGQGQPHRPEPGDGAKRAGEDLFVARQPRTGAHDPSWSHGRPRASHLTHLSHLLAPIAPYAPVAPHAPSSCHPPRDSHRVASRCRAIGASRARDH